MDDMNILTNKNPLETSTDPYHTYLILYVYLNKYNHVAQYRSFKYILKFYNDIEYKTKL